MGAVTPQSNQALIAELWARFAPVIEERLTAIESLVSTVESGQSPSADQITEARYASHNLAGSLGSYGKPVGSDVAREIQHLIDAHTFRAERLRPLLENLRAVLDEQ